MFLHKINLLKIFIRRRVDKYSENAVLLFIKTNTYSILNVCLLVFDWEKFSRQASSTPERKNTSDKNWIDLLFRLTANYSY